MVQSRDRQRVDKSGHSIQPFANLPVATASA